MKYYYALYKDDYVKENKERIIKNLESNKWQFEIYLVTLTNNETNHLEIFNSVLLLQKTMSKDNLFVVGITNGYSGALELVEKITQEVYDETDEVDIRNYILRKQREYEERNV